LLAVLVNGTCACFAQSATSMHRGLFYENRPFGALAFIKDTYSKPAAQAAQRVLDLSQSSCVQLPLQSEYWFLINHQNVARAGESGFFAIKIHAHAPSIEPTDDLRIHRTAGFVDGNGRPLPEITKDPSELSIGAKTFTTLHDDSTGDEQSRLRNLVRGIGEWHAQPDRGRPSSWSNRRIFADRRAIDVASDEKLILGARLMKFTTIASTLSVSPMVFSFNPSGMRSFRISISAPSFDLFNQTTEMRVGFACEQTQSAGLFGRLFGN
jgi:hypothetical protein